MISTSSKVGFFVFLLLAAGVVNAKVYKWVDANGETHYSEEVPAGRQKSEVQTRITTPSAGRSTGNSAEQFMMQQELDKLKHKSEEDARARATAEHEAAAKEAKCARAKQVLNFFQQKIPIATITADGKKVYMNASERAIKIDNAQQEIAENCN